MPRPFNCGVCLWWISGSVLLYGSASFTSKISTYIQLPNATVVQDEDDTGSPFLQLRASLPSYSQPVRPYTLLTNAEDYLYMPTPRHRHPSRLLRLLGSSFDLFWMSIEQPSEASVGHGNGQPLGNMSLPEKLPNYTTTSKKFNFNASPELRKAAANHRQKLLKEAAGLDLGSLPSHAASSVRDWLVRSATCGLSYQWVDLGPAFWPQWLRQTDCERSDGVRSCSFPGGMECVRAQTTHIKILAWHCLESREEGDGSRRIKADRSDGSSETGTGEAKKRCTWRQVPYPVVTACTCSCL